MTFDKNSKVMSEFEYDYERWNKMGFEGKKSWTGLAKLINFIANSFIGKTISWIVIITLILAPLMRYIFGLGIHIWFLPFGWFR